MQAGFEHGFSWALAWALAWYGLCSQMHHPLPSPKQKIFFIVLYRGIDWRLHLCSILRCSQIDLWTVHQLQAAQTPDWTPTPTHWHLSVSLLLHFVLCLIVQERWESVNAIAILSIQCSLNITDNVLHLFLSLDQLAWPWKTKWWHTSQSHSLNKKAFFLLKGGRKEC